MAKEKKIPKTAINREQQKTVKAISPTSTENKPLWRFSSVDKAGPFCWPKGENEELTIVSKLHEFDSMTWDEISGKQHHILSPNSLSKEAKDRLELIKKDDEIENLFSFHLQGEPRIIAIKHSNVAKLLWYDPEHKVAPSKKKHT